MNYMHIKEYPNGRKYDARTIVPQIYEVGDAVLIKEWDEMAKEFGMIDGNDINCPSIPFTEDMKKYCGKRLTVRHYGAPFYFMEDLPNTVGFTEYMVAKKVN